MVKSLDKALRNQLERTVKEAREVAEAAARAVIIHLGVGDPSAPDYLSDPQRVLRKRLRIHGHQLGDNRESKSRNPATGRQDTEWLIEEIAYEHWHRMLFARFLAENELLMYPDPEDPVAVTIEECRDLAAEEGARNGWELAARFAAEMLPEIFRTDSPVFEVELPPEGQQQLQSLLVDLPSEVFDAADSLGWVYQFWQGKRKDEVNASGDKIGARELPAVTQLFTEDYMVQFLLDNTLGAWWAGKVEAASCRFRAPPPPPPTEDPEDVESQSFAQCQTESDCRQHCALPDVPWSYLRFLKVEAASSRLENSSRLDSKQDKSEQEETRQGLETTRQDAASTIGFFHREEGIANLSGNLPHWRQDSVTYFVTLRTADSLPQTKLAQWLAEREQWLAEHPRPHDENTRREYHQRFTERIEHWLDQGYGACHLKQPEIRQIVEDALHHFEGERYYLDEFVVAANHVHVIVTPHPGFELSEILHSWKSFTSKMINRKLGKTGVFWQKESFDHILRNPDQLERLRIYIRRHHDVEAASSRLTQQESSSSRLGQVPDHKIDESRSKAEDEGGKRQDKMGGAKRQDAAGDGKRQDAASTWRPAAGTFPGWPQTAAEIRVLDPCMGSGHFLVFALPILAALRTAEEDLAPADAVDAVLRDNLFGLEIDPRCTQIAAFNLALTAWRMTGFRRLPPLNLACTGIAPQATEDQWVALAEQSGHPMTVLSRQPIENGLRNLHQLFSDAPTLGSLIDPNQLPSDLFAADYETLKPYLDAALSVEQNNEELRERAVAAAGMVKAAELLAGEYTLVATNVPYLKGGYHGDILKTHCERLYSSAKYDLATVAYERCMAFLAANGAAALVSQQYWLFLKYYQGLRKHVLTAFKVACVARLGPGAFETISGDVVNVCLQITLNSVPDPRYRHAGIELANTRGVANKRIGLLVEKIRELEQHRQLYNPDYRISFVPASEHSGFLSDIADFGKGSVSGDAPHYLRVFWEIDRFLPGHKWWLNSPSGIDLWTGREYVILWGIGNHDPQTEVGFRHHGQRVFGKRGVAIGKAGRLRFTPYSGELFDDNLVVVCPYNDGDLEAVWGFCNSEQFEAELRRLDKKMSVTAGTFTKVACSPSTWFGVNRREEIREPYSSDPTQWLFHGRPEESTSPLQVAVARLLGYRWPAELDDEMRLSERARALVRRCDELSHLVDRDGLVAIPAVRGETPAADRLLNLLANAYGSAWSTHVLSQLLKDAGFSGKSLENWLRDGFFTQHCALFHQRPFIWQIWDGLRDGFSVLVNYHRLDRKLLETLIYNYVGDWIAQQKQDLDNGVDGAEDKIAAAVSLQKRLELIRDGEAPLDIFVRWKPLHEQPIGWDPDLNDGVRMNIRPFMSVSDVRAKGAGVLRVKPKIKWGKDRGKEPERPKEDYPWFWGWDGSDDFLGGPKFTGERFNDCHYTLQAKRAARERTGGALE